MIINFSNLFNRFIQDIRTFSYRAFSGKQLIFTFIPSVFVLAALIFVGYTFEIPMGLITRDVTAIAEIHPLSGILSSFGMIVWTVSGTVTAFAALFFWNINQKGTFRFMLFSSILSFLLLADDFFLVHEVLAPYYLGINEVIVYAFLSILIIAYLIIFYRAILLTNFILLILALGFMATSVVIDMIIEPWMHTIGHWAFIIEDGLKWLGIASWCSYNISASYQHITRKNLNNDQCLSVVNPVILNLPSMPKETPKKINISS